jgi:hypothetical protein
VEEKRNEEEVAVQLAELLKKTCRGSKTLWRPRWWRSNSVLRAMGDE